MKHINKYNDWEKGVIMAWGHVLYLGYHDVKQSISKIVSMEETKKVFLDYYNESDSDEDMQDWMSDGPPTMNGGYAVFDKNRLSSILEDISNKTKLEKSLEIYRYTDSHKPGWNSYTLNKDNSNSYSGKLHEYILPKNYPVIFTEGLADTDEVIVNLTSNDLKKYSVIESNKMFELKTFKNFLNK